GNTLDLWGTSWTPAEVNSSNFGVQFKITNGGIPATAYIDHVRVFVYYTTTSGMSEFTVSNTNTVYWFLDNKQLIIHDGGNIYGGHVMLFDITGRKAAEVLNYSGDAIDVS